MSFGEQRIHLHEQTLTTRKDFLASYHCDYNWHGEQSVRVLDAHNVFDVPEERITYASKKLPLLTVAGLYMYFGGTLQANCMNSEGKPSMFDAEIGKKHIRRKEIFGLWEKQLGLLFREQGSCYRVGPSGRAHARLLYLLGFSTALAPCKEHRNSKTSRGATLPAYLTSLIEEYSHFTRDERELARKYLRDLVAVAFDARGSLSSGKSYLCVRLIAQRSADALRRDAEQLLRATNIAYPSLKASLKEHFTRVGENDPRPKALYQGYLKFSLADIVCVSTPENFFPAKARLELTPRFSYERRWEECAQMEF